MHSDPFSHSVENASQAHTLQSKTKCTIQEFVSKSGMFEKLKNECGKDGNYK
jgi:hypothetical protein